MKRNWLLKIGMMGTIGIGVLSGCSKNDVTPIQQSQEQQVIGMDRAKEIALKEAGVTVAEVTFTKESFDQEQTKTVYELEFNTSDTEYEYEIDAYSGQVLKSNKESIVAPVTEEKTSTQQEVIQEDVTTKDDQTQTTAISQQDAINIAISTVGLNAADVQVQSVVSDIDDGKEVYEVKFVSGQIQYEVEIDKADGKVYNIDQESIYDN